MTDQSVQDFVDDIAKRANVDPAAAESAVGTILYVIQKEGDPTKVGELFQNLPGASQLAQSHAVTVGGGSGIGGALSGLAEKVIGADAGLIVAALTQIEQTNLSVQQIKDIGTALLAYLKDSNPALAKEIIDAIPGLQKHLA